MQREAEMIGGMARRLDRADMPAAAIAPALDDVAVAQLHIGHEVAIAAFLGLAADAFLRPARAMRAEAIGLGAGRSLDRGRGGRVVVMRVGDEDVGDGLAVERLQQRVDMVLLLRAGIDHRDLAVADDVGAGALEGERAGIARDDAADQRRQPLGPPVFEGEVAAERDFTGHDAAHYPRRTAALPGARGFNLKARFSTRCQERKARLPASKVASRKTCHHSAWPWSSQITICSDGQPKI